MSTETISPVVTAPIASPNGRPPTPVNPTSQKRPTPNAAPTASRPDSSAIPDLSKARPAPDLINSGLKEGISKIWNSDKAPPANLIKSPTEAAPAVPAAPIETIVPPVEAKTAATVPEPVKAITEPIDRFADIAEPEGISEAGKKGWKALKTKADTELKATEKKLADAEAQLATLRKATPADIADVERLKAENQKALDRLAVLDLQSHPDFTRQYSEPKAKALSEANEVLSYNGKDAIDPNLLFAKSQKDFNAAVAEATKDMNAMDAMAVQSSLRAAYKLTGEESQALSKAGELRAGIEAKTAQQSKQAFEEVYGNIGIESILQPRQAPDSATADERAEVEMFNQKLSSFRSMSEKNVFGRLSPKDAAALGIKAAALDLIVSDILPVADKGFKVVVAQRDSLIKELQAIKGLKSPGSFTAPTEVDTGEKKDAQFYLRQAFGKK